MVRRTNRRLLSVLAAVVVAVTAALVVPGTAHAGYAPIDYRTSRLTVTGVLVVANDQTDWMDIAAEIEWEAPDGVCVYLRVDIDRPRRGDKHFYSPTICNRPGEDRFLDWDGYVTYSGTRGARITAVWPGGENEIIYEEDSPIFP